MRKDKSYLAIGLVIGIVLASLFFQFFAPRYTTVQEGETLIKQDKWSGKSWRYASGTWVEMKTTDSRQEEIDKELRKALMVVIDPNGVKQAMTEFKELFPALKDVPDEELLSRMSALYSREVMSALFLQSYHQMLREKAKLFRNNAESSKP